MIHQWCGYVKVLERVEVDLVPTDCTFRSYSLTSPHIAALVVPYFGVLGQ